MATFRSPQNAWQTILQTEGILASDSGAHSSRSISAERTSEMFFKARKNWLESQIWLASNENLPFCGLATPNPRNPGKAWMTSAVTAKTTSSFKRDCMSAADTNFSNSTISLHSSWLSCILTAAESAQHQFDFFITVMLYVP